MSDRILNLTETEEESIYRTVRIRHISADAIDLLKDECADTITGISHESLQRYTTYLGEQMIYHDEYDPYLSYYDNIRTTIKKHPISTYESDAEDTDGSSIPITVVIAQWAVCDFIVAIDGTKLMLQRSGFTPDDAKLFAENGCKFFRLEC